MSPRVSIVVPIYNAAPTLARCLDSLLNQTEQDIEIICVDDASTDNSKSIIKKVASTDERVRVIELDSNVGSGAARNIGINFSHGEFVGFVDADDFIAFDFYARLCALSISGMHDIVKGSILAYNEKDGKAYNQPHLNLNAEIRERQSSFIFGFTSAIFRKTFLDDHHIRFMEGMVNFEDPPFAFKSAVLAKHIAIDDAAIYYYVTNPLSSTQNPNLQQVADCIKGSKIILDFALAKSLAGPDLWGVKNFLCAQLKAWQTRSGATEEMKVLAMQGLKELGLLLPSSKEEACFRAKQNAKIVLAQLQKRIKERNNA